MAYKSKLFSFYLTVCPPPKKNEILNGMTAKFGTHVVFMLFYSLTGSYFNKNHRIDLRGDSRHIILVRIKVDLCGESAGLFSRNFVGQKNSFNFKF